MENNMQMIDVMKRLAELDAANPAVDTGASVVKPTQSISINESQVEECGMMDTMGARPSTPASINITAGSGDEIADMLATIMHLAGAKSPSTGGDMGDELTGADGAAVMTAEPEMDATSSMRSVIDKLHPEMDSDDEEDGEEDDEETDESVADGPYDNSPDWAAAPPSMKHDAELNKGMHNQEPAGRPGVGDRIDGKQPKAFATFEDQLMSEWKHFVSENKDSK